GTRTTTACTAATPARPPRLLRSSSAAAPETASTPSTRPRRRPRATPSPNTDTRPRATHPSAPWAATRARAPCTPTPRSTHAALPGHPASAPRGADARAPLPRAALPRRVRCVARAHAPADPGVRAAPSDHGDSVGHEEVSLPLRRRRGLREDVHDVGPRVAPLKDPHLREGHPVRLCGLPEEVHARRQHEAAPRDALQGLAPPAPVAVFERRGAESPRPQEECDRDRCGDEARGPRLDPRYGQVAGEAESGGGEVVAGARREGG
ncbi:hypothetical protein V498_10163, partial [Pseudogymnoascus sp. VKM F-4517 (FW-2822)]